MRGALESLAERVETDTFTQYWLLAGITTLAVALRMYKLGAWSFWIDELFTANHAVAHFSTPSLILSNIVPAMYWTPLSVILTAQIINIGGLTEFHARVVPALVGVATVPLLFLLVKQLVNTRVALISALLLAVSPWHLEWSQNARGYTSLLLFSWLAIVAFWRSIEKDRPGYLVLFYVFLYFAASERMVAFLVLPVVAIYVLTTYILAWKRPRGLRLRNFMLLAFPGLVLVGEFLVGTVTHRGSFLAAFVYEVANVFSGRSIENPLTQVVFIIFKLGLPLSALALVAGCHVCRQRNSVGYLFVLTAVVPILIVGALTPFVFTEERYALISLPACIVLAAIAIDRAFCASREIRTLLGFGLLAVLLADAAGANLMYFRVNHGNRWDNRSAFAIVRENLRDGDLVVSNFPQIGNYYLNRRDVANWDDVNAATVLNGGRRVWFVVLPDMAWFSGTQDFYWWVSHHTRMIKTLYARTADNMNLEIYLFDPDIASQVTALRDPK